MDHEEDREEQIPDRETLIPVVFIKPSCKFGIMKSQRPSKEVARFWRKVKKLNSGCWLWMAAKTTDGYGQFGLTSAGPRGTKVTVVKAHRWAYEQLVGEIPTGLVLHHKCHTRNCVNPDHLEAVTHENNVLEGSGPTAANARKDRCLNGHPLSGANLITHPDGRRECRTCSNDARLAHYHRKANKHHHKWKTRKQYV